MQCVKFSDNQAGFTLIELMLSCALSLFLLGGLLQIYASVQKTFMLQDAIMTVAESGRFATHFLTQNIRIAGYAGCEADSWINQEAALHGYQNNLPAYLQGKVVAGNDTIEIGRCRLEAGKQQFIQDSYIISETGRKNALGNKILALYLAPYNGNKRELVPDVTAMKINYGIVAADGENVSAYFPAQEIKDWRLVRAVKIMLLLSSEKPIFSKPQSYQFADNTMSSDRFLHAQWDIYVALRERL